MVKLSICKSLDLENGYFPSWNDVVELQSELTRLRYFSANYGMSYLTRFFFVRRRTKDVHVSSVVYQLALSLESENKRFYYQIYCKWQRNSYHPITLEAIATVKISYQRRHRFIIVTSTLTTQSTSHQRSLKNKLKE